MKLNKIEIVEKVVQLRFLKTNGVPHRATIKTADIDGLEALIEMNANSVSEPVDLSKCELIRAMAAIEIGEDSELSRIDFHCGADSFTVNEAGEVTENYSPTAFMVMAKEKDKRTKDDGRALGIAACFKCPKTGSVLDTDIDAADINADLKAMAKAVYSCEGGKYKEINGLMLEEDQPDTPVTKSEKVTKPVTEMIDGKAVDRMVSTPVEVPVYDYHPRFDEADNPVPDPKDPTKQALFAVPRMKKGKKVSATKLKRLATLLAAG